MALSSAKIVGANPHIERPYGWKTFYVTPDLLTGIVDVTVTTLPAYTVIMGMRVMTYAQASGVSTVNIDIEVGATGVGDTVLLADSADAGSTIGTLSLVTAPSIANLLTVNVVSLGGSDLVVNAEITYGGTETTAPTYLIAILCGRNEY
jgi:hypothetical protein